METRKLGRGGLEVSAIGLGCMGINFQDVARVDDVFNAIMVHGNRYAGATQAQVDRR